MKQNTDTLTKLDQEIHVTANCAFCIHQDNDAVAILTLKEGHNIPLTEDPPDLSPLEHAAGGQPVYRTRMHVGKLAMIAAALGADETLTLEFPFTPGAPARVVAENGTGWIMPALMLGGIQEGLLVPIAIKGEGKSASDSPKTKEEITLPPPIITASEKRMTLEIDFQGKPPEELRNAIKSPDLGFRYSGGGTKRGVPPKMWYGPNNPYTQQKLKELFPDAKFKQAA